MWSDKDLALALQLQEQFNREQERKTPIKHKHDEKLNLGSEDLELIDPTPDVHALFVQFDKKFFWSSLSSVVVRWSKRMYSCAGICRYQGRGGFCDIALSEPLLKLRPRKNLIETLLHEMIHAFLFITQKDRDRDGHGPNFQMHMHRINKEANINITIYHSFIDEVNLYKVHWWRCNGICQNHKPFYGIVRRSTNRAPGPNDFWWQRHKNICSGTFIKINEPVKVDKKKTISKDSSVRKPDIRKFLSPKKSVENKNLKSDLNTKEEPPSKIIKLDNQISDLNKITINKYLKKTHSTHTSKILTIDSGNKSNISKSKNCVKNISNDFPTFSKSSNEISALGNDNFIKTNSNKDLAPKNNNEFKKDLKSEKNIDNVASTVRNHWCNKYLSNNITKIEPEGKNSINQTNQKSLAIIDLTNSNSLKEMSNKCNAISLSHKNDNLNKSSSVEIIESESNTDEKDYFSCPVCNISISALKLNQHLDNCLKESEFKDEFNNEIKESNNITNNNKKDENKNNYSVNDEPSTSQNIKPCPICEKEIIAVELEDHLENCLNNTFNEDSNIESNNTSIISLFDSDDEFDFDNENKYERSVNYVPCPCCCELIDENCITKHIESCLILE